MLGLIIFYVPCRNYLQQLNRIVDKYDFGSVEVTCRKQKSTSDEVLFSLLTQN